MKKTLSLLLTLIMLLSVTGSATVSRAVEEISSLHVYQNGSSKIVSVAHGGKPCFNLTTDESDHCSICTTYNEHPFTGGISWEDKTNSRYLSTADTFTAGHTYEIRVAIQAHDGYAFKTTEGRLDLNATIITYNAYDELACEPMDGSVDTDIIVSKTFECPAANVISDIKIELPLPTPGSHPSTNIKLVTLGIAIDPDTNSGLTYLDGKVRWLKDGAEQPVMRAEDIFEKGCYYTAGVSLKAEPGYTFALNGNESGVRATIAGIPCTVSATVSQEDVTNRKELSQFITVYPEKSFYCADMIQSVRLNIDSTFSANTAPQYAAESADYDSYYPYSYRSDDCNEGGISYYDLTDQVYLKKNEKFVMGHKYQLWVCVTAAGGCGFPADLSAIRHTVNGIAASPRRQSKEGFSSGDNVIFLLVSLGTCKGDLNNCSVTVPTRGLTYTGTKKTISPIVKDGSYTLKEGKDFEVLYLGDRTNAGKCAYELNGLGNYEGTSIAGKFTIKRKALTPKVRISAASYTYDGKVKKPTVKVYAGSKLLKNKTDYTYQYSASSPRKVGNYTVTATLKGNYTGSKTVSYQIVPKGTTLLKTASCQKTYITPQWHKQTKGTTGYEIMYSTSSSFKKNNKTVLVTSNKTTVKKITGLKKNTAYYFKIRTYTSVKRGGRTTNVYSKWSPVKKFKTRK